MRRKKFLIKSSFQFKYAFLLIFAILFVVAIVAWNLYYEAGAIILNTTRTGDVVDLVSAYNKMLLHSLPMIFLIVAGVSIFISHEVAGPLTHLEKSMQKVREGDLAEKVQLRHGDEFKDLAVIFNDMTSGIRAKVQEDRDRIQRIIFRLEDMKMKIGHGNVTNEEIDTVLRELKEVGTKFNLSPRILQ